MALFTSVMFSSRVIGAKSRKRKSSRSWHGVTMAAVIVSGRIHAGILASGRYLSSTAESLESSTFRQNWVTCRPR